MEYDEDDEEEEEEEEVDDEDDNESEYADDEAAEDEAPAEADYGGFSIASFLDDLDDDDEDDPQPTSTRAPLNILSGSDAATRTAAADSVQGKDDKGTDIPTAPTVEIADSVAPMVGTVTTVNAMADQVTPTTAIKPDTTAKTKKSQKAKKIKKKKSADAEGDIAYEILNGLLELFN